MKPDAIAQFEAERNERLLQYSHDQDFQNLSQTWLKTSMEKKYVYNFDWLGRPIIQYPQDILAIQELVWSIRPDLIIETGIAHGGSLILSASLLALLDLSNSIESGTALYPKQSKRKVLGIDIDIREHNHAAITSHPLACYIDMIQGSSISDEVIARVQQFSKDYSRIMVFLDSMHTQEHVLAELDAYATLVSPGSYCVVFDTFVEDMPPQFYPDRPWDVGNNPKTALAKWLPENIDFEPDLIMENKLQITVAPNGFLQRKR